MARRALAALVIVGIAWGAARAESPRLYRLTYVRGAGAARCPDPSVLMSAVAVHLGYVPWDPQAEPEIALLVEQRAGLLRARVELRLGARAAVAGARELTSAQSTCQDLAAAVALAIAIAIDPLNARLVSPSTAPASRPTQVGDREVDRRALSPPAPPRPAPPPPRVRRPLTLARRPYQVSAAVGGLLAVGSAPALGGGIEVQTAFRWTRPLVGPIGVSLGLEARIDLPAEEEVRGHALRSSLILGSLLSCAHWGVLSGCGLVSAGALLASGEAGSRTASATTPYVGAAIRLAVDQPLVSVLSLRGHADLLTPFTRVTLIEDTSGDTLWTAPAVSGAFGLCLVGQIL